MAAEKATLHRKPYCHDKRVHQQESRKHLLTSDTCTNTYLDVSTQNGTCFLEH